MRRFYDEGWRFSAALLGLADMLMQQLSVRCARKDDSGPETGWSGRSPAPAGALQRKAAGLGGYDAPGDVPEDAGRSARDETRDVPAPRTLRWSASVPDGKWVRIALGVGAVLVLGAAVGVVLGVRSFLTHDDRFVVAASAQIQTEGNQHLMRAQVLSVFGEDVERNIFKVPLTERRADLERLPWVAHATVMRLLPNRLRVSIVERTPVAFVRQGSSIGLVDASGVLLDLPENTAGDARYSFPVLTGLEQSDPLTTRAARMEIYRRFVKELDSAGTKISDSLSEVDVSNPEDLKALIPSEGTDVLVHFGDEDFLERYRHFEDHLAEWKQQYPKLASADMRYDRQVVLEMQAGAGVPVNATAGDGGDAGTSAADGGAARAPAAGTLAAANLEPVAAAKKVPMQSAAVKSVAVKTAALPKMPLVVTPAKRKTMATPVSVVKGTSQKGASANNAKMYAALAAARQGGAPTTPGTRGQQ